MANGMTFERELVNLGEYVQDHIRTPAESESPDYDDTADRLDYVASRANKLAETARQLDNILSDL